MPIPQNSNRQDAYSTKLEQARCLFHLTLKIIPLLTNAAFSAIKFSDQI
ncbi:MAG: hypothetical protein F6J90_22475 [Moorea sp. SIOASIH]|nr:hypothetical protein [Moorena sp. SIOASIH]